jgi:LPXTG-motif cell wall-anchored protein
MPTHLLSIAPATGGHWVEGAMAAAAALVILGVWLLLRRWWPRAPR